MPVITLIWMVDDTFGFKDDYVAYTMTPEIVLEFLNNHLLWQNNNITELLKQREIALKQLSNKAKRLDFLQKNRLIYAFQKNIVKNQKFSKYFNWFELAEKTKNKLNEKADFLKYTEDEIFVELIRKISKDILTDDDYSYIEDCEQFTERVKRWEKPIYQEGLDEGMEKGIEKERKTQQEKQYLEKLELARTMKKDGESIEKIMKYTSLTKQQIENLN